MISNGLVENVLTLANNTVIRVNFLPITKYTNLLLEREIKAHIDEKYNNITFDAVGDYLTANYMDVIVKDNTIIFDVVCDIIQCIITYSKQFYDMKAEYDAITDTQLKAKHKVQTMVDIKAITIDGYNFDMSINEMSYLYTQYKDIVVDASVYRKYQFEKMYAKLTGIEPAFDTELDAYIDPRADGAWMIFNSIY